MVSKMKEIIIALMLLSAVLIAGCVSTNTNGSNTTGNVINNSIDNAINQEIDNALNNVSTSDVENDIGQQI